MKIFLAGFAKMFFIFLNLANKFLKVFHINKVIFAKFLIIKTNLIGELIIIMTLVILYNLYRKINFYLFYMNNTWDGLLRYTKHYSYNFYKENFV